MLLDLDHGTGGLRECLFQYAAMLGHTEVLKALLEHTPPGEHQRCLVRCARVATVVRHLPEDRRTAVLTFIAARSRCPPPVARCPSPAARHPPPARRPPSARRPPRAGLL